MIWEGGESPGSVGKEVPHWDPGANPRQEVCGITRPEVRDILQMMSSGVKQNSSLLGNLALYFTATVAYIQGKRIQRKRKKHL